MIGIRLGVGREAEVYAYGDDAVPWLARTSPSTRSQRRQIFPRSARS